MNMQNQLHGECQLAVIAMLADVDISVVRRRALTLAELCSWDGIFNVSKFAHFWPIVNQLASEFGVGDAVNSELISPTQPGSSLADPDLCGTGQIAVVWANGTCHAMAYENGRVFDPNFPKPSSWQEWLDKKALAYPGSIIDKIIITKHQTTRS